MRLNAARLKQLYQEGEFYPNRGARIVAHMLLWCVIIFIFVKMNQRFFRSSELTTPVVRLTVANCIVVLSTYYWLALGVLPALYQKRWWLLLTQLIAIYAFNHIGDYFIYTKIADAPNLPPNISSIIAGYRQSGLVEGLWSGTAFSFNWAFSFNVLMTAISLKFMKDVLVSQIQLTRLERDNLNLELNFLRSQINPHFVFNAINSAYALVVDKDDEAADILVKLSSLMRYALYKTGAPYVPLQQEINFLTDYVDLERIRHSDAVSIYLNTIGQTANFQIPPLLLLTFVENAFKHGVNATIHSSWVTIDLVIDKNQLRFIVKNSKPSTRRPTRSNPLNPVSGIGLANTQRRLKLLYPDMHQLQIDETPTTYTVNLTLTLNEKSVDLPDHRRRTVSQRSA